MIRRLRGFIRQYLDQSTRLGEVLFGLIMAMGVTGAVRFGLAEANNRQLFIAVLGCNIAWGIVDGVMFVMLTLFDRARQARILNHARTATTDQAALDGIHKELGDQLETLMTRDECNQVYRWVLNKARQSQFEPTRIRSQDVLAGIAVGTLVLVATLPTVVPFLLLSNAALAVRMSNGITLVMMFGIGWWWGRVVGTNPLTCGASVAGVGFVLVLLTILLGG